MRSAMTMIVLWCVCNACSSSGSVHEATAPSGRKMMRVSCPSGWEECTGAAQHACGTNGFRSETSGDQDRILWFRCLPEPRGDLRATTDAQGRKAWRDRCRTRAECTADATAVCPEGYSVLEGGSESDLILVFRCNGDSD